MKTGLQITIPEPCTQQWRHLEPRAGGRFCGACGKLVVDFTRVSDRELLAYFKNHPGNVCGNFHPDQTDRVIAAREYPNKRFPRLAAAVAALLFLHNLYHAGSEVTRGVKYVLRTDVMYRFQNVPQPA